MFIGDLGLVFADFYVKLLYSFDHILSLATLQGIVLTLVRRGR